MEREKAHPQWRWILAGGIFACVFQLFWFGSRCIRQIDIDGMDYVGIARHLRDGQFFKSINAFRSPVISWLIAGVSFFVHDFLQAGKVVSFASYLLCLVLLFLLTERLWHSKVASSLAVLWFVLARGTCVLAVQMVTADFLLTAFTLLYFLALLHCFQRDNAANWTKLGVVHGIAFLAKAFALPWLAIASVISVALAPARSLKIRTFHLALALLFPALIAASWATVLHAKYGYFVTGSQFKTNFLQSTVHAFAQSHSGKYTLLRDTSGDIDEYMVNDPMPPGSWPWSYRINPLQAIKPALAAEAHNIPRALKEITILLTPGGILAFIIGLLALYRIRREYRVEFRIGILIAISAATLILGYCMLVFDGRYALPIVALLIAFSSRFFLSFPSSAIVQRSRHIALALLIAGLFFSMIYWASPFRTHSRDYQLVCYHAGHSLNMHGTGRLVSLGTGPFPQYGVGWEAGYKSSYFGGWRLIAAAELLPAKNQQEILLRDLTKAGPDAVAVWGSPANTAYREIVQNILREPDVKSEAIIRDPVLGETGSIIFFNRDKHF